MFMLTSPTFTISEVFNSVKHTGTMPGRMAVAISLWIFSFLLLLTTAGYPIDSEELCSDSVEHLSFQNGMFALDLYNKLRNESGNIIFSPVSISTALAMVLLGSRENTKAQMLQTLHFEDGADSDIHRSFRRLVEILANENGNFTLKMANRLYGAQDYEFLDSFIKDSETYYGASLQKMDFGGDAEGSRKKINEWVEEKTEGKIGDLFPTGAIDAQSKLVLVNAIYFRSLWQTPFKSEDTIQKKFHTTENQEMDTEMMSLKGKNFKYTLSEDLNAQIISLPYSGDASLNIILPEEVNGVSSLEATLTMEKLNSALQEMRKEKVEELSIPKLQLKQKITLIDYLTAMGMKDLFAPGLADLSGISDAQKMVMSGAVHEAFIDINEEGTEAAGSTGMNIGTFSIRPDITFIADHPFIFFIRHDVSGSILFMGRFAEPSSGN